MLAAKLHASSALRTKQRNRYEGLADRTSRLLHRCKGACRHQAAILSLEAVDELPPDACRLPSLLWRSHDVLVSLT